MKKITIEIDENNGNFEDALNEAVKKIKEGYLVGMNIDFNFNVEDLSEVFPE